MGGPGSGRRKGGMASKSIKGAVVMDVSKMHGKKVKAIYKMTSTQSKRALEVLSGPVGKRAKKK